jgi:hypothetical protein
MQISTKQKLLRVAAGSIFAAGAAFIPTAAANAESEAGRIAKAPPELPDMPTDPAEGLPVPNPGNDG